MVVWRSHNDAGPRSRRLRAAVFAQRCLLGAVMLLGFRAAVAEVVPTSATAAQTLAGPPVAILRGEWHDDYHPADLHALAATVGVWGNTRFTRYADGLIDLMLPGERIEPCDGLVDGIRLHYYRWGLADFRPTRRVGDLCDALFIRELSPSDLLLGAQARRAQGMIDWSQLIVADCGDLLARPFGVSSMSVLRYPYWPIDRVQAGADHIVHTVSVFAGRFGDALLNRIEHLADPRHPVPVRPGAAGELVYAPTTAFVASQP